jgi:hypothetical protein
MAKKKAAPKKKGSVRMTSNKTGRVVHTGKNPTPKGEARLWKNKPKSKTPPKNKPTPKKEFNLQQAITKAVRDKQRSRRKPLSKHLTKAIQTVADIVGFETGGSSEKKGSPKEKKTGKSPKKSLSDHRKI